MGICYRYGASSVVILLGYLTYRDVDAVRFGILFPSATNMWTFQTPFPLLHASYVRVKAISHLHAHRTKKKEFIRMEVLVNFVVKKRTWLKIANYGSEVCTSPLRAVVFILINYIDVDNADTLALMGTSDKPGADEDDFHTFRRNRHEIEKEAIEQEKRTRLLQGKVGARSDIVKPFRTAPIPTKKVVFF